MEMNTDDSILVRVVSTGKIEVIKYDYLIICTGASYELPIRDENALTLDARKKSMRDYH